MAPLLFRPLLRSRVMASHFSSFFRTSRFVFPHVPFFCRRFAMLTDCSSGSDSDSEQVLVKPSRVNDTLSFFPTPLSSLFSSSTLYKSEGSTDSSDYDKFSDRAELGKESKSIEKYCASEMNVIAKYRGLHEAELYIEKAPESCSREFLYETLLANCVRQNKLKKAEKVFGKMQDFKFPITLFTCNELLYLYMRNDCKEKIGEVLGLMTKENIKLSSLTYSILIDALGQSKDINGINQAVDFMKAHGIEPVIHTQAVLAMHYISCGLQDKGETLLKEMGGAENLKQNRWLCPVLLHVYANLGRVDEVGKIWEVCETNPRYKECLVAIAAWGKLDEIEEAEKVFEMVRQVKKWKNFPESWEVMLKVYKDNNMLMDHEKLLRQMGASEVFINPVTLDKIVNQYVEAGEVEKADSVLRKVTKLHKMAKWSVRPMFTSYGAVLKQYASRGDIHNTEKILRAIEEHGYSVEVKVHQISEGCLYKGGVYYVPRVRRFRD